MSTYLCADVVNHNTLEHFLGNAKDMFGESFDGRPVSCIHFESGVFYLNDLFELRSK